MRDAESDYTGLVPTFDCYLVGNDGVVMKQELGMANGSSFSVNPSDAGQSSELTVEVVAKG